MHKASLPILKERCSKNAEVDLNSVFKNAFRVNSQFVQNRTRKTPIKTTLKYTIICHWGILTMWPEWILSTLHFLHARGVIVGKSPEVTPCGVNWLSHKPSINKERNNIVGNSGLCCCLPCYTCYINPALLVPSWYCLENIQPALFIPIVVSVGCAEAGKLLPNNS